MSVWKSFVRRIRADQPRRPKTCRSQLRCGRPVTAVRGVWSAATFVVVWYSDHIHGRVAARASSRRDAGAEAASAVERSRRGSRCATRAGGELANGAPQPPDGRAQTLGSFRTAGLKPGFQTRTVRSSRSGGRLRCAPHRSARRLVCRRGPGGAGAEAASRARRPSAGVLRERGRRAEPVARPGRALNGSAPLVSRRDQPAPGIPRRPRRARALRTPRSAPFSRRSRVWARPVVPRLARGRGPQRSAAQRARPALRPARGPWTSRPQRADRRATLHDPLCARRRLWPRIRGVYAGLWACTRGEVAARFGSTTAARALPAP